MPTKNSKLLPTGTLYLQNEDGTLTPFMGLFEAALLGCNDATFEFVGETPVVREMTFTIPLKRPTRAQLHAAGCRTKQRSKRAIGRPIRRIKRLKEKARRYTIKHGIDKKIIAHYKKYWEEHKDEGISH
jgi:hypothetical protein